MYPAVLKSCAVANTSAHWMPLLFFLTLYGAWWALPSVYVVYFCCMELYYYYKQTRKKTQIPQILIFFNKEYSVFPNLQCASCWFPFIVLPLPCPLSAPPPPSPPSTPVPTNPPTHLLSCCDKDRRFPRLLHRRALNESICCHSWWSFSLRRLKTQCATCSLDSEPLTHGSKVISCLLGYADKLSSWNAKSGKLHCLSFLYLKFKLQFSSVLRVNAM